MIDFIRDLFKNYSNEEINSFMYENNLQFYTILKLLLKCSFSDKQLYIFQREINKNREINDKEKIINSLLEDDLIVSNSTQKYEDLCLLVNTLEQIETSFWLDLIDVSIDLIIIKNMILEESKKYVGCEYKNQIASISDKLSFEYDLSNLSRPYGQRVISSLLVQFATDTNRVKEYELKNIDKKIKIINNKIKMINKDYKINCNNIFSLIMNESMNQSITSDAGQSYEERVHEKIKDIFDDVKGHSHDSKISSVEYDFTFKINDLKFGVSAKRTLRERYKQNFENSDLLDVDYMMLFTLGIDLNEDKLKNILQKKGLLIVVSDEMYENKDYLKNNDRVISSKDISRAKILDSIDKIDQN